MADIFISYSTNSRDATVALATYLEDIGYSVWWDTSLQAGEYFSEVIDRELNAAGAVIVIWTPFSIKSKWVYAEASRADEQKKLITVNTSNVFSSQFPLPFNSTHSVPVEDRNSIVSAIIALGVKPTLKTQSEVKSVSQPEPQAAVKTEVPAAAIADEEVQAWASVKNSTDIGLVERFLKTFPDSRFAYIAHLLLERLLKEEPESKRKHREEQAEYERFASLVRLEQEAADEWPHVEEIGEIEIYQVFAERYAETRFFAKARNALRRKGLALYYNKSSGKAGVIMPGSGKETWFQDADFAPEMVVIPPGKFLMGSVGGENNEYPQLEVRIDYIFAVGRFAVTFDEWDIYASQVSNAHKPQDQGWGRGNRPVIDVSWNDAQGYVTWLSEKTGEHYRLLSEAEWEYVCRAGTNAQYWWGNEIYHDQANYQYGLGQTLPVDSFEPNPWGLYNVHGNVFEWVKDQWHDPYMRLPADGSAWEAIEDSSMSRVLRGGYWNSEPQDLCAAMRFRSNPSYRNYNFGFRIARSFGF